MKKSTWTVWFGVGLVLLSSILYFVHYLIFKDAHHIAIYFLGDLAFVPIEVLAVSLIIHKAIERKEKEHIMEKLNMLIGAFYSEVGIDLLDILLISDTQKKNICGILCDVNSWKSNKFKNTILLAQQHTCHIDIRKINIEELAVFLKSKRHFLLGLLQNPSLLEHEAFTELLRSVFHLEDELHHYINFEHISEENLEHLTIDIERVYPLIINQWIVYMNYLKNNYPYLFSINERYNPFKQTKEMLNETDNIED